MWAPPELFILKGCFIISHPAIGVPPPNFRKSPYMYIYVYIYIYGKCLGFARTRNDDGRRIIIIIIINIMFINIIIIIIKPLLTIFNECRNGVGELNPYWRSSMNVEV